MDHTKNNSENKDFFKPFNKLKIIEPYVGPRPFERNDKDKKRFFGRENDTNEILSLIYSHKLVLIYAQSGAGKTSLFNAKIIPMLEEHGFQVLPSARIGNVSNNENYPSSTIESHNIKNAYMFSALQSILQKDIDPQSLFDKQQLADFLKYYYPPIITDKETGEVKNQVLIFDQLEELFDAFPRNWKEQREDFFNQIAIALEEIPTLQIVFIIREDYLAQLDPFKYLLPQHLRPKFRLERLDKDSAVSAIKGPLETVSKDILQNYKGDIDKDIDSIVHELLKIQIEYSPGKTDTIEGEYIEPIQLQVVLTSWWNKITSFDDKSTKQNIIYVSDVDTALEEFYEDAIKEIIQKGKIKERYIRKWCEENLITQAGTRSIVYKGSDTTAGLKNNLIKILEDKYLIKENIRAGARWCELTHDRLIKPIVSSNQKWRIEHQKRKKLNILKISIPMIISIIIIYGISENLYLIPTVDSLYVGTLPYLLSVDQTSGLVYVTNPKSDSISVINGKRNDLIKEINVPNEPTDISVDSKNNLIYVSHPYNDLISVIEGSSGKIIKLIEVENPLSIALNSDSSKLYVTSEASKSVSIVNTHTNKILNNITVGNFPTGVSVDSKNNLVYVANRGDNTVTVIDEKNNSKLKDIQVGEEPSSIAINYDTNKVYVANMGDNTVTVIDEKNNSKLKDIQVGEEPSSIAINYDTNKVYVANLVDKTISVIDGELDTVVAILNIGNNPTSVNINEDQNILYVINNLDHNIIAIDMDRDLQKEFIVKSFYPISYTKLPY